MDAAIIGDGPTRLATRMEIPPGGVLPPLVPPLGSPPGAAGVPPASLPSALEALVTAVRPATGGGWILVLELAGGESVEARSALALASGTRLLLRSLSPERARVERVLPAGDGASMLMRALRTTLPAQRPLHEALATLATAARDPALPPALAERLRELLARVPTPGQLGSARGLRAAVADSGAFLEARLLRLAHPPAVPAPRPPPRTGGPAATTPRQDAGEAAPAPAAARGARELLGSLRRLFGTARPAPPAAQGAQTPSSNPTRQPCTEAANASLPLSARGTLPAAGPRGAPASPAVPAPPPAPGVPATAAPPGTPQPHATVAPTATAPTPGAGPAPADHPAPNTGPATTPDPAPQPTPTPGRIPVPVPVRNPVPTPTNPLPALSVPPSATSVPLPAPGAPAAIPGAGATATAVPGTAPGAAATAPGSPTAPPGDPTGLPAAPNAPPGPRNTAAGAPGFAAATPRTASFASASAPSGPPAAPGTAAAGPARAGAAPAVSSRGSATDPTNATTTPPGIASPQRPLQRGALWSRPSTVALPLQPPRSPATPGAVPTARQRTAANATAALPDEARAAARVLPAGASAAPPALAGDLKAGLLALLAELGAWRAAASRPGATNPPRTAGPAALLYGPPGRLATPSPPVPPDTTAPAPEPGRAGRNAAAAADARPTRDTELAAELLGAVRGALARTRVHQIAAHPDQSRQGENPPLQAWSVELPIARNAGFDALELRIEQRETRADPHGAPPQRHWQVQLCLQLETLGTLHARLELSGERLATTLWIPDPHTLGRARAALAELGDCLRAQGVEVTRLDCHAGEPPARPALARLLEVST